MNETESKQVPAPTKQAPAYGTRLGVIALILGLLVAALALALWFEVRKMRGVEAQLQSSIETLEKHGQELRTTLAAEALEREKSLEARQKDIEQGMQELRDQLGREHHDWVVAESDYLLRYANRRLLLERDVRGALIALRSVDALLAAGANPLYLPVREQLRAEILSLEALPAVDVDGIALELSGLSKQLDTLPLATARRDVAAYQAQVEQQSGEEGNVVGRFFSAMWNELKSLVTVRHLNQKIMPLLPPEQRYFLNQNLRLRIEMARLALLRGEAATYQENLATAIGWLDEYYDSEDAAVKHVHETLARLARIDIAPPLPEISASLRSLERIVDKQPSKKPAANQGPRP